MTLSVSIVIPTWNSESVLAQCLGALEAQGYAELIVVDNDSRDSSREIVADCAPGARIICFESNRGFSVACNRGIAESTQDFVLLLNDDAVLGPGYLAGLTHLLKTRDDLASAVGKLTYMEQGKRYIDSVGIDLCAYALRPSDRGHGELDLGQYDRPMEVFGPSAAATLYRRSALLGLGEEPFDESLFAYYEDVDLAWRLSRQGWKHAYDPSVGAEHTRRGPGTKPLPIRARAFANRYIVWAKNESAMRFATYAPVALSWEAARLVRRALQEPGLLREVPSALSTSCRIVGQRFLNSLRATSKKP